MNNLTSPLSQLLAALIAGLLFTVQPAIALASQGAAPVDPAVLAKAVDQMEELDRMRISLASSLEGNTHEAHHGHHARGVHARRQKSRGDWPGERLDRAPGGQEIPQPRSCPYRRPGDRGD